MTTPKQKGPAGVLFLVQPNAIERDDEAILLGQQPEADEDKDYAAVVVGVCRHPMDCKSFSPGCDQRI